MYIDICEIHLIEPNTLSFINFKKQITLNLANVF